MKQIKEITLKELVSDITEANKHTEIDWGFEQGNEKVNIMEK